MVANRMNRDEFYATMAPTDEASLRKTLWTLYWRGEARLRERIEDALRPPDQPKVKPKKEVSAPETVLNEVAAFAKLARDGAYMAGTAGCTTPSGPSGGSRSAGWRAKHLRRFKPTTPGQPSKPSRR